MSVRCSLRGLRLAAGLVATGVVAAFVLPATSAVAALHGPRSQHGPAPVALAPLPVRNGSAHKTGPVSSAQTAR
jgi:hypothetical protein